ncbi:ABC transporter substrate-binding protein [Natronobacterium gregoryi]|nr:ABC transporter substrate-binding protein [Natronobacterium gregoryi]ELY74332.1 extracellular ligand-binding receptor [Natronobacterium gregoryi SP2]
MTGGSVASVIGLAGCVGDPEEATGRDDEEFDTVRLGVLEPRTGEFAELGEERHQGNELGIQWVNESDEYDFEFEYESFDTQTDPADATREAEEAIQDYGVDFLTGCISSSSALAVADIAEENGVVYTPGAADISITGDNCSEYVFRFETNTAQMTEVMAQWTDDELGDRIFYHIADYVYGESVRDEFEARMAALSDSYENVGETASDPGATDFDAFITQIQDEADEADALVVGMTGADLGIFLQQAGERGLQDDIPIVTTTGSFTPVRGGAGLSAVGVYSGVRYSPELQIGDNQAFVEAYEDEFDELPDNFSRVGFDSIRMLANGIQEAGSRDPDAVKEVLNGLEHETIFGPNRFRECDGQAENPVWMGELVEPDDGEVPGVTFDLEQLEGEDAIPDCEDVGCDGRA